MPHGRLSSAINIGFDEFSQLVAAEVPEIAGVKGRHDPERRALGHGTEQLNCAPWSAEKRTSGHGLQEGADLISRQSFLAQLDILTVGTGYTARRDY